MTSDRETPAAPPLPCMACPLRWVGTIADATAPVKVSGAAPPGWPGEESRAVSVVPLGRLRSLWRLWSLWPLVSPLVSVVSVAPCALLVGRAPLVALAGRDSLLRSFEQH